MRDQGSDPLVLASLRAQLKNSGVRVFELAPPGTETPLFHNDFTKEDVGGPVPTPVATLAMRAIAGLAANVAEIRPGLSNVLKIASRLAPDFMLRQLGKSVDLMLSADKNGGDRQARAAV